MRSGNYLLPLKAVPVDEARDFTKENGPSSIETPTPNCTNLELLYRQFFQEYNTLFLRDK